MLPPLKKLWNSSSSTPRGRQRRPLRRPTARRRFQLESLEDRVVLSTVPLDLSTAAELSGTLNNAIFTGASAHNETTGSGLIDSFVRLDNTGVEQGYNTDARSYTSPNDAQTTPTFDHALRLSALPVVVRGTTTYYEFALDINQKTDLPKISLDELRFYVDSSNTLNTYNASASPKPALGGDQPVWDMADDSTYNSVLLNYSFNSGSGNGLDMFLDVPTSYFGPDLSKYVYLYSKFGVQDLNGAADVKNGGSANDGYEEWARGKGTPLQVTDTITGHKYDDVNDNDATAGIGADDTALPGWTINLYDSSNHLIQSTTTGSDGSYKFNVIGAGTYFVQEQPNSLPGSWTQTYGTSGYAIVVNADGTVASGSLTGNDFANHLQPGGTLFTISGYKYYDHANDDTSATIGTGDDTPLQGWAIDLTGGSATIPSQTTDANGFYQFAIVVTSAGTYTLSEEPQLGWTQTATSANPLVFADAGNGTFMLTSGHLSNNDFANFTPANPTIVTQASTANGVVGTTVLSDSATLSGTYQGTGSITFTLDQPDGTTITVGSAVTVSGDGTYYPTTRVLATQVGTYTWHASYSGDGLNNGAVDDGTNESLTTVKASPSISTSIQVTGDGTVGATTIGDTATLSGGYNITGGTISFTLDTPSQTGLDEGTVDVVAGTFTYTAPNTVSVTEVGTYTWHATYSGDGLNNGAVDNGANESLTSQKASPSISTQASETAGGVVGTSVLSDSATITGGYNVTGGSITFTLDQPDGTTITVGSAVTVSGDGTYYPTTRVLATQVGTYTWHASYSGDGLNNGAIDDGTNESLTTVKASPTLITTASFSAGNVVGSAIPQDKAVLSGGYSETGTITFKLYAPDNSLVDTETATPSGDGTYTTSNTHVATQVGTYTWKVTFAGDGLNNGAVDQGGSAEQVTVIKASPTLITTASFLSSGPGSNVVNIAVPEDKAVLSGGYNETGTITFKLYAPNNSLVYTEMVTPSGDGTYITHNTAVATQVGTYTWRVTFAGDTLNNSAQDQGGSAEQLTTVALHSTGKTRTIGYWANQGNSSIKQADIDYLNTLWLRNADGSRYTITGSTLAKKQQNLANFLNSAGSTNMANMLSAQLIGTYLNTSHGFVSTSTYVYVGGIQLNSYLKKVGPNSDGSGGASVVNSNGFAQISDLLAASSGWLASFGNTVSTNYARNAEEAFKNVFDAINSDKSIFL